MWQRHWGLSRDPFDGRPGPFVAVPSHAEAVARLSYTIGSAGRSAGLVAGPGLGKSTVLARALEEARDPTLRIARASASGAADGATLFATLAAGLGARVAPGASRSIAWRSLVDAARLCRWQGLRVVLAVDDVRETAEGPDRPDLERLDHLDSDPAARVTVLRVGRPRPADDGPGADPGDWTLAIRLPPLTRAEAWAYVGAKLGGAGRPDPAFTPRALTRLHALSGGVPRGLDRLAALALMAAAARGLEIVPPDVVDEAARECSTVGAAVPGVL